MTMRKDFVAFYLVMAALVIVSVTLLTASCFAQTLHQPTSKQEENLKSFLQGYLRDPFYDHKATRYFSSFIDLKDDGTQQVIVYFTDQRSCGSGGCTTLILTPKDSSYEVVTSITIAWPPIRVLASKLNGWRDIAVQVHGGGVVHPYEAKLSFNGKTYPRNPTVPPAQRLAEKVAGEVVVPLEAEGKPLYQ
jgi:hypothetical protein